MELDTNKIDDAVLALLFLGRHNGARAWKGFDWDAMNRLHERGYITDPSGPGVSSRNFSARTPNNRLQQTGHASDGFSSFNALPA